MQSPSYISTKEKVVNIFEKDIVFFHILQSVKYIQYYFSYLFKSICITNASIPFPFYFAIDIFNFVSVGGGK